jgi:pimeloyl-ACP methyl ester carboxylesterase
MHSRHNLLITYSHKSPSLRTNKTLIWVNAFALTLLALAGGCWQHVEEYCAGCTIIDYRQTVVPPPSPGTDTEVVLIHGAFGFGEEWSAVIAELKKTPGYSFFAWSWPGPFRNPPRTARALGAELQALIDGLPETVQEVIVLAHSAGGLITNLAARQLRVPRGRRVTVALLDPALRPTLAKKEAYLPLPPGVSMTLYFARDAPKTSGKIAPPDPATATDLPREYVGDVGHNAMVAKVVLPLLAARRRKP